MFHINNQIKQELKYIATRLPTIMEGSTEVHYLNLDEAAELFPDEELKPIQKGALKGKVIVRMPVMMACNHYRRLKKAYISEGESGVIKYINKVRDIEAKECN